LKLNLLLLVKKIKIMYTRLIILMLVCNLLYAQQPKEPKAETRFYLKSLTGEKVDKLYYSAGDTGHEKLLFDPGTWHTADEKEFIIKNFSPNNNDSLVCISVGTELSEKYTLLIVDVATGKILEDIIFNCSNFNISWLPDNQSFSYCRSDMGVNKAGEMLGAVYFHKVGTSAAEDASISLRD